MNILKSIKIISQLFCSFKVKFSNYQSIINAVFIGFTKVYDKRNNFYLKNHLNYKNNFVKIKFSFLYVNIIVEDRWDLYLKLENIKIEKYILEFNYMGYSKLNLFID